MGMIVRFLRPGAFDLNRFRFLLEFTPLYMMEFALAAAASGKGKPTNASGKGKPATASGEGKPATASGKGKPATTSDTLDPDGSGEETRPRLSNAG